MMSSENFELANVTEFPEPKGATGEVSMQPTLGTPPQKRPVDIKTASMTDLQAVQGVGPAKAKDIVNLRDHESGLSRSFMGKLSTFKGVDLDGFEFNSSGQPQDGLQGEDGTPQRKTEDPMVAHGTRRGDLGHHQRSEYGMSDPQRGTRNQRYDKRREVRRSQNDNQTPKSRPAHNPSYMGGNSNPGYEPRYGNNLTRVGGKPPPS